MAEFSDLTIPGPPHPLNVGEWNGMIEKFNALVIGLNSVMTFDDGRKNMILSNGSEEGKLYLMDTNHHIRSNRNHGITISTYLHPSQKLDVLTIRENTGRVGIGTSDPKERFQIGDKWTFHDGGTKFIGYNQYYDGQLKRITSGYAAEISLNEFGVHFRATNVSADANTLITHSAGLTVSRSGNVGIGTDNPQRKLHIVGDSIRVQKPGTSDHYVDIRADGGFLDIDSSKELWINNSGQKVRIKNLEVADTTTLKKITLNVFSIESKAIDNGMTGSLENKLVISNGANKNLFFLSEWGELALYTSVRLHGFLDMRGHDIVGVSDRGVKKDISDLPFSLEQFLKLRPVSFRFNGKLGLSSREDQVGLIAQEVQEVFPFLIDNNKINRDDNTIENDDFLRIKISSLVYYAIAAIKELNQKVEQLKLKLLEAQTT